MNVEPIIKVRFNKFKEQYELNAMKEGLAFERFVNHTILSSHQPDAFGADSQFLEKICVGGYDDMGIDGIGIKLNGFLISDLSEAKDIVNKFQRVSVEFIFIQSKMSTDFDTGEFSKFTSGIRDFLSEEQKQPTNAKLKELLIIKDYILDDEVVELWEKNPSVRAYYVAMGKWQDGKHINAYAEQFKSDISKLNAYGESNVHFIDAQAFKVICENNENTFKSTIEVIETMPLTEVDGVHNSCVALCYASEFIKLLSTDEGVIRKSLFNDNVRDYQGSNSVNEEILNTLDKEPEKFALLNNGITIVCDEYTQSNRRITIKNPQIVNGCQTSHVLYFHARSGGSTTTAPLHVKIISTNNLDITNQIVRGTNRQNIVYDEAFEATKIFHKELEEFFMAIGSEYGKVYYERRSKQFQHNPKIKQTEKINLKTLTQYSVAVLLGKPHMSHRHEAKLIEDFSNRIFLGNHSKLPYYMISVLFSYAEKIFRNEEYRDRRLQSYKPHILTIFRQMYGGDIPALHKEKQIDIYSKNILKYICDPEKFRIALNKSIEIFEKASEHWTEVLGRSSDGRKDIEEFTKIILQFATTSQIDIPEKFTNNNNDTNYGEIKNIIIDRNGKPCGFIKTASGDIFFHSSHNYSLDFNSLKGTFVSYDIEVNNKSGRQYAVNVAPIDIN